MKDKIKNIIKYIFKYIFTINKKRLQKSGACGDRIVKTRKQHLQYRIFLILAIVPILYVLLFSYFENGFNLISLLKTLLFILFFRIVAKDVIDLIIIILFYKSSYEISDQERRKIKLKKINRKSKLINNFPYFCKNNKK